MFKKLFNILLIFMLCICFVPSFVFAEDEVEEEDYIDENSNSYISTAQFITNKQYLGYPNTDVLINDFGTEGEKFIIKYDDGKTITYLYDKETDLFLRTDSTDGSVDSYYDFLMPEWEFADSNQGLFKKGDNLVLLSLFGFKAGPITVIGKNPNIKIKDIKYIPTGNFTVKAGETNPNNLTSALPNIGDKLIITYDDNSKVEYTGVSSNGNNVFKDKNGNELNSGQYYLAFTKDKLSYEKNENTVDFCLIDTDGMTIDNSKDPSQYTHKSKINVTGVAECEHEPTFIEQTSTTYEHYKCNKCGKLFSDKNCQKEVSESSLYRSISGTISGSSTETKTGSFKPSYGSISTKDANTSNSETASNSETTPSPESTLNSETTPNSETTNKPAENNDTANNSSGSTNTNPAIQTKTAYSTWEQTTLHIPTPQENTTDTQDANVPTDETQSDMFLASTEDPTTSMQEPLQNTEEEITYEYEDSNSSKNTSKTNTNESSVNKENNNTATETTNISNTSNTTDKIIAKTGDNNLLLAWISIFAFIIGIGTMFIGMKRIYN